MKNHAQQRPAWIRTVAWSTLVVAFGFSPLTGCDVGEFFKENTVLGLFLPDDDDDKVAFLQTTARAETEEYDPTTNTYTGAPDMLQALATVRGVVVQGELVVFTDGEVGVQRFDPTAASGAGEWTQLDDLPEPRTGAVAVAVGSEVVVLSGVDGSGAAIAFFDVLNLADASPAWKRVAVPAAVSEVAAVAHDGKVYLLGGRNAAGAASAQAFSFDPATDTFTATAGTLPGARVLGGAFVAAAPGTGAAEIHIVGGHAGDDVALATEVVFSPATETFSSAISGPVARIDPQVVVGTTHVLVLASRTRAVGASDKVDLYDIQSGVWNDAPAYPVPVELASAVFADGTFFVFGGRGEAGTSIARASQLLSPSLTAWSAEEDLPIARHSAFAADLQGAGAGHAVIAGGATTAFGF
jgi:hypothetical protein